MMRMVGTVSKYRAELFLIAVGLIALAGYAIVQRLMLGNAMSTDLHFLGVPLDDVYIHTRFAQNLLNGFGYCFNHGQIISSDTSPLWVLLIALGGIITSHLELVAIAISVLSYLIIAPGVYRISRNLLGMSETKARIAGFATVLSSRLLWGAMSGMETALAALLMLLIAEEHIRSRRVGCIRPKEALWLGLGLLLRPEFLFVAIVLAANWTFVRLKHHADLSRFPMVLLVLFTIASPAYLLSLITSGSIISHSSIVQGASFSYRPNVGYLWFALKIIVSNNGVIFILLLCGSWFLRRRWEYVFLTILVFGLPIIQSIVAPQFRHHGRYFFPIFPLLILFGIGAWSELSKKISRDIIQQSIPLLIILAGFLESCRWAIISAESVRNINDQHLQVVEWLRHNTNSNDTLAVDDVGAIGYFLNKPVIDLTGLMTPTLWPLEHNQDSVWQQSRAMGANVFVIINRLNPPFYDQHKDSLALQQEFRVRLPLASSADTTMSIYRMKGTSGL